MNTIDSESVIQLAQTVDSDLITEATHSIMQHEPAYAITDVHWEFRLFKPHHEIMTLNHLNDSFLDLENYQIKYKSDTYYLLPHCNYNVKMRNDAFFYKPMLGKTIHAIAFGKKINLSEEPNNAILPGIPDMHTKAFLEHIKMHGKKITVQKEALIYRFNAKPKTKLELAKLRIGAETYYSLSIESPAGSHVESLTKQLLGNVASSDYISFLKTSALC